MQPNAEIIEGIMRIMQLHMMFNYHHADHRLIHPAQFPILRWIGEHEGCTQTDIAQHLMIKPSTVAISIQRLEKTGHIERVRDEADHRIWRVSLTEQSKAFKQRMFAFIGQEQTVMLQGFDEADVHRLHGYLMRIQDNLKQSVHVRERNKCEKN